MTISNYEDLDGMQLDALREIGSIGAGNAATSLSNFLNKQVSIDPPTVSIIGMNEAVDKLGGPEKIVAGLLIRIQGEFEGAILSIQDLDVINMLLESLYGIRVDDFAQVDELQFSAISEVGNILMASYVYAISDMAGLHVHMEPPAVSVNMLGGMITVPMALYCYEADKVMLIEGSYNFDNKPHSNSLLLIPNVDSLKTILTKLGVYNE